MNSDTYVDHAVAYKAICTNFVTEQFFGDSDDLYAFLTLVVGGHEEALAEFRQKNNISDKDIFFIYKGGNLLRIVEREFLAELPATASAILSEFYSRDFKRSDADFSIYVNPKLPGFRSIVAQLTDLSFVLQRRIRDEFMSNLPRYFSFFTLSPAEQRLRMQGYLTKFVDLSQNMDRSNVLFYGRPVLGFSLSRVGVGSVARSYRGQADSIIRPPEEGLSGPVGDDGAQQRMIRVSRNTTLKFLKPGGGDPTEFTLSRSKVIFNVCFGDGVNAGAVVAVPMGGELIDVTVPVSGAQSVFDDVEHAIVQYTVANDRNPDGDEKLRFLGYSVEYLQHDLEHMLFIDIPYPWLDNKYAKRLNRLCYLGLVELYGRRIPPARRLPMLNGMVWVLRQMATSRAKTFDVRSLQTPPCYYRLMAHVLRIYSDPRADADALQHFLGVVMENLSIALRATGAVDDFIASRAVVPESSIYARGSLA